MREDIRKELAKLDDSKARTRNFGLLIGGLLLAWAGAMGWRGGGWLWPAAAGFALFVSGLLIPSFLRRPYRLWMLLGFTLGWLVTRVILTLAYVLVVAPTGLLLRMLGKDVLDERIEKRSESYWKKREPSVNSDRYRKQF